MRGYTCDDGVSVLAEWQLDQALIISARKFLHIASWRRDVEFVWLVGCLQNRQPYSSRLKVLRREQICNAILCQQDSSDDALVYNAFFIP